MRFDSNLHPAAATGPAMPLVAAERLSRWS